MSQQTQTLGTFQYYWRLIRYSVKYFITDISTAFVFWLSFTVIGLILRAFFNYLTGDEGFSLCSLAMPSSPRWRWSARSWPIPVSEIAASL
jgi:hypothetical protein